MKPSHIRTTIPVTSDADNSNGIIDRLSAAFRSQTTLADKERVPKSTRNKSAQASPTLRKRSSSNINRASQEFGDRRRDSNGINYSNFINALSDYQKSNKDDEHLFTVRNEPTTPQSHPPVSPKTTGPPTPTNRGRIAKRLSATFNTPIHHSPHGNASSVVSKAIKDIKPIEPADLGSMLQKQLQEPLLIDMRPLEIYEKSRIRNSINVNVPTLLVKRYRRGVVSNFNLESFITTPEGTDLYRAWLKRYQLDDIQDLPESAQCIVYDDHMTNDGSATWILMGVLHQNTDCTVTWLNHGYEGFNAWDFTHTFQQGTAHPESGSDSPPLPYPSTSKNQLFTNKLKMPTPMVSRSATTLSSKNNNSSAVNVQRRASLFSLDTTMRKGTTGRQQQPRNMISIAEPINTSNSLFSPDEEVFHTPLEQMPTSGSSSIDQPLMTAMDEITPRTENEYDFVISEIIPNFLYLGPEIATVDQLGGLKQRSIKRILNMAEECDDDVPGLKEAFKYQKVAARDTVEMHNVQGTLKKAVQVIDDSKKHHEPIYVHCKAGKSRSAAAILAYLVLSEHWTLKKAYRHIVKARPNISPNIGFVAELMKMEEGVHGQVSNFAGTDWHLGDSANPPSPDTMKEMGRLERAWKRGRSSSNVRSRSGSSSNNSSRIQLSFNQDDTK